MERVQIIRVLEHIRSDSLSTPSDYVSGNHFVSEDGVALPPNHASINRVARNCIGGASIRSLVGTGTEPFARRFSPGYWAVMLAFAETLGFTGSTYKKVLAVQQFSNEHGYIAVNSVVDQTLARLKQEDATESARP